MQGVEEGRDKAHSDGPMPRITGHFYVAAAIMAALFALMGCEQPDGAQQEATGRTIVMAARGWQEWPTEAALPACEWDRTGSFHLVTPCEEEGGLVYYRNPWVPKRWTATQRREL
ncbi:MAG: hypothetical protein HQL97_00335 [Magnetococcales bacterium]|nr:hypothetical protein [Magnetococcales bacterium]